MVVPRYGADICTVSMDMIMVPHPTFKCPLTWSDLIVSGEH